MLVWKTQAVTMTPSDGICAPTWAGVSQNQVPQHPHHLAAPVGQQPDAGPPGLQVRGDGDQVDRHHGRHWYYVGSARP
jgi:hypothetical protein